MHHALSIARRGLGRVCPNPAVGCVIVKNGIVIGAGYTQDGGRPHAETVALQQAGRGAKTATAYVTLEPCAHHGQTPPCAERLINAGIKRVVVACGDPDPRVSGKGIKILRNAGVQVEVGVLEDKALELNAGFFSRIQKNRPLVTLKMGVSADGMIAAAPGQKTMVTGPQSHAHAHLERSMHDAILVGAGTVAADDPLLTTRLPGYQHKIIRTVLDTNLTLPVKSRLVQTAQDDVWVYYADDRLGRKLGLESAGIRCIQINPHHIQDVLPDMASQGMTRLLVEGGAKVFQSFLKAGLVDRVLRYQAPHVIGPGGLKALPDGVWEQARADLALEISEKRVLGKDLLEIFTR
jgi:diaminohydroxyphosphoribosylaminopyrimidine deaminase/5-amino-6-(5-phosphoribosylamino)uracil reductase